MSAASGNEHTADNFSYDDGCPCDENVLVWLLKESITLSTNVVRFPVPLEKGNEGSGDEIESGVYLNTIYFL